MQRVEEGCDGNAGETLKKQTCALIITSSNNPRRYAQADSSDLQAFAFGCRFNICRSCSLGVKCVSGLGISVKSTIYFAFYKQSCTAFSYGCEEDVGRGMKLDEFGEGCKSESGGDFQIKHYVQFASKENGMRVHTEMLLITLDWVLT